VWVLLQTTSAPVAPALTGGYGAALLQAVLALLAVSVLAWVVLRGLARGGLLRSQGGRVRVLERTALDPRHALVLVEVDGQTLLLGVGEGSAPALIRELPASAEATGAGAPDDAHSAAGEVPGAGTRAAAAVAPAGAAAGARQSFSAALARVRLARAADSSRDEKNSV
jgi:flagellar biogenesis protein FliO